MTPGRTYLDYLEDIQDVVEKIADFIEGTTFEHFQEDTKTTFAVIRALEILGEATKSIPDSVRQRYPEVPGGTWLACETSSRINTSESTSVSYGRPRRRMCPAWHH